MSAESGPEPPEDLYQRLDHILFDKVEVLRRIAEMGREIEADYKGKPLTMVTILQGGMLFMADLIREVHLPMKIDSLSVSSYGSGTTSSGTVTFHQDRMPHLDGRHILILDDILDSGRTLRAIMDRFAKEGNPLSMKVAVLLSKKVERAADVTADYYGFEVGNEFVVGYGLDYDGEYRNLPVIGVLKPEFIH